MKSDASDTVRGLFGGLLMAVGGLMAILCGLCTTTSLVFSVSGGLGPILMVLLVGGVPTVVGFLIFRVGKGLYDGPPRGRALPPANFSDGEPPPEGKP